MKKICLALLLAAAVVFSASRGDSDERILEMNVSGVVSRSAHFTVTEEIKFRAEGINIRRGLIRSIPTHYTGSDSRRYRTDFEVISAALDGKATQAERSYSGGSVEIRIGDPDRLLSRGIHTITLSYRTRGWIAFRDSFDELYWNVTGTGWDFPIDRASFALALPGGAAVARSTAYTGRPMERGSDFTSGPGDMLITTRTLAPGEGFTAAYAWDKGIVTPPRDYRPLYAAGLVLLIAGYYFLAWYFVGRDPEPRPVVPLYRPPGDMEPGFARYLRDMKFSNECLASDIIQLAVLGFVSFRQDARGAMVIAPEPAERRGSQSGLSDALSCISGIIEENSGEGGLDVRGNGKIWALCADALEKIYSSRSGEYFRRNRLFSLFGMLLFFPFVLLAPWTWPGIIALAGRAPIAKAAFIGGTILSRLGRVIGSKIICGVITAGLMLALFRWVGGDPLILIGAAVSTVTAAFFSWFMSARTEKGARASEEISGLYMYMNTAERHRLAMLYKPDETPQLFESLLPYACALDASDTWADSFSEILSKEAYAPGWDRRESWGTGRPWRFPRRFYGDFAGLINSSAKSYRAELARKARKSSRGFSGGSGFGSGGGVGGGGGGGGGRGW
ncbi:MAG: DUF2207 domain-containing protein [Synergistaceae bacterium]|nr:DUF2207 domain-containing protein [Synergistaceae bacterium]